MNPGQRLGNDTSACAPGGAGDLKSGVLVSRLRRLAKGTNRALGVLFQDKRPSDRAVYQPVPVTLEPASSEVRSSPPPAIKPTYLVVALSALAHSWPPEIRDEIAEFGLAQSSLSLPAGVVRRALKQGHIAFSWRLLRSSLRPTPPPIASDHDAMQLELPIKTIASLFLALQSKAKSPKGKLSGHGPMREANPDDPLALDPQTADLPSKPAEIVTRAMAFKGVVGALVLLPDGWIVASRLPQNVNGDALAAFLPQVIDKLDECGEELGMHQLTRLNFALGGAPWNVFRLKTLIFAAFGGPEGPLPSARLTALATELEH